MGIHSAAVTRLISLLFFLLLFITSAQVQSADCDLVYDEFDSLMNKNFLLNPEEYVPVLSQRLSRADYNTRQKGNFLLSRKRSGLGVAIVRTNKNRYGKLLFTWSGGDNPVLNIAEVVLFGRVEDGERTVERSNLKVMSSFTLDLDTGRTGGEEADIWFHNINGREMYIEAVNGADLTFPLESLCAATETPQATVAPVVPIVSRFQALNSNVMTPTAEAPRLESLNPVIKREITAEGFGLITYADGSKLKHIKGGVVNIAPNGGENIVLFSTGSPVAYPVEPPDETEAMWLGLHRLLLLGIIQTLVDDPALVEEFEENVDVSENLYESIEMRRNLIYQLVSP